MATKTNQYIRTEVIQQALSKISAVEQALEIYKKSEKKARENLFNDLAKRIAEQREEILKLEHRISELEAEETARIARMKTFMEGE